MEIREFAERILCCSELERKLARAPLPLTDGAPGAAVRVRVPARSELLKFAPRRTAPAMPRPGSFRDPRKRAVAHHIMANHELQALEVMAFMLCAFPDAPGEFRQGLVYVMGDEQRHTRMHVERAAALGLEFGDLPVNSYIWQKAQSYETVLDYLAGLPLTFESRNLDHTLEFETHFRAAGDERSAAIMQVIHRDEIQHVAFGLSWLQRLKPADDSDWDAYCSHLKWPLRPSKSLGEVFDRHSRIEAGMSNEFLERLQQSREIDRQGGTR
jgi:uncharacterized ferritin-like protein (DUF455 family)